MDFIRKKMKKTELKLHHFVFRQFSFTIPPLFHLKFHHRIFQTRDNVQLLHICKVRVKNSKKKNSEKEKYGNNNKKK